MGRTRCECYRPFVGSPSFIIDQQSIEEKGKKVITRRTPIEQEDEVKLAILQSDQ